MTTLAAPTWQNVQAEVTRRISERIWLPGDLIPNEVDLAKEFGCSRATANRALRQLAEAGLLIRRRKAGTRVARHPVRKAKLDIPITRLEIEQRGARYGHELLGQTQLKPTDTIRRIMKLSDNTPLMHLQALHLADDRPFLYEDRWVNIESVPGITKVDFKDINANEWLVQNAPFTRGDIVFSAANASPNEAKILDIETGEAIFIVNRVTWNGDESITAVRLAYAPDFEMATTI